ncbi:hypothetical protein [Caulobacter segnis]
MTASGTVLAGAGERLSTWALNRLAVTAARSERRYPPIVALIVALILALAAWAPVIVLYLLLKDRFQ